VPSKERCSPERETHERRLLSSQAKSCFSKAYGRLGGRSAPSLASLLEGHGGKRGDFQAPAEPGRAAAEVLDSPVHRAGPSQTRSRVETASSSRWWHPYHPGGRAVGAREGHALRNTRRSLSPAFKRQRNMRSRSVSAVEQESLFRAKGVRHSSRNRRSDSGQPLIHLHRRADARKELDLQREMAVCRSPRKARPAPPANVPVVRPSQETTRIPMNVRLSRR